MTQTTGSTANKQELAAFLRRCRERTNPKDLGLPPGSRRRTPGLRREEIAILAGVSPTWYTYLEQGRDIRPSADVLASLARVLRLSPEERSYLYLLSTGSSPPYEVQRADSTGDAVAARIVATVDNAILPVYAADVHGDLIAWNEATTRWYADFAQLPADRRNMLWWMHTDPVARERLIDWEAEACDLVGRFRQAAAARAWDPRFEELIEMLEEASPDFRRWWSAHVVRDQRSRPRTMLVDGRIETNQLVVLRVTGSIWSVVMHLPLDLDVAMSDDNDVLR